MEEAIEDVLHKEVEYPFTQFVVCVGFLLVLIIENIAVLCKHEDQPDRDEVVEEVAQQIASLHSSTCSRSIGMYYLYCNYYLYIYTVPFC